MFIKMSATLWNLCSWENQRRRNSSAEAAKSEADAGSSPICTSCAPSCVRTIVLIPYTLHPQSHKHHGWPHTHTYMHTIALSVTLHLVCRTMALEERCFVTLCAVSPVDGLNHNKISLDMINVKRPREQPASDKSTSSVVWWCSFRT